VSIEGAQNRVYPWSIARLAVVGHFAPHLSRRKQGVLIGRQRGRLSQTFAFIRVLIAFSQEKTDVPNVLPWSLVPELVERVGAAKERRRSSAVSARTFFHDRDGRPWANAQAFRRAFNKLREKLEQQYGSFATRYYVGLVDGDPLAVPTSKLTIRTPA
jgi:hypothetical protein